MDWKTANEAIKELASQIDFKPAIIVAIPKGGLIPARLLAKYLEVDEIYALNVKRVGDSREITSQILADLHNKNVLIVEDTLETGKSLQVAKEYIESLGALVKTTCLYIRENTQFTPDYYLSTQDPLPILAWD